MSYMEDLLTALRERYGLDEEGIEFVKTELVRSFKNGLMRGREASRQPKQTGATGTEKKA